MFGPRPAADLMVHFSAPAMAASELDGYLSAEEAKVANLKPWLAKEIVWLNPASRQKTALAIVYVHGFSASKGEIRPVVDRLAANIGANVFYTRLTGHGAGGEALAGATVNDWMNDVAEALWIGSQIGEQTVVIATSTGATLITPFLAQPKPKSKVAGVVLISPNFGLKARGSSLLTAPFAGQLARMVLGTHRRMEGMGELQEQFWTTSYPVEALLPMAALVKTVAKMPFARISTPALFYYDPDDRVVDSAVTDAVYKAWGGPKARFAPGYVEDPYRHVVAGDALSPSGTEPTLRCIETWLRNTFRL